MPEILRPRLERFCVELPVVGDLNKRVPKQVRVEVGQSRRRAGFAEDLSNWVGVCPRRAIERNRAECEIVAQGDLGFREQRVAGSEALFLSKESYPVDDDLSDVVTDWKEPCREGLRPLGADLPRVLLNQATFDVDVLQTKRDDRPVSRARHDREGDERAVTLPNFCLVGHSVNHRANLRKRRAILEPPRCRGPRQVVGGLKYSTSAYLIREA